MATTPSSNASIVIAVTSRGHSTAAESLADLDDLRIGQVAAVDQNLRPGGGQDLDRRLRPLHVAAAVGENPDEHDQPPLTGGKTAIFAPSGIEASPARTPD